jgi:hypothetical protein
MKPRIEATVAGAVAGLAGVAEVAAQSRLHDRFFGNGDGFNDISSAGNGGVATASANGGAVSLGDINSGGNAGNAIAVGNTYGMTYPVDPTIYGGNVSNATTLGVSANGGTAIADASGGNYNLAFVS